MRTLLAFCAFVGLAVTSSAATVTKGSLKHNVSISDTSFAEGGSATTMGFSHATSLEAALIPGDIANFNGNTLITGNFPLGPQSYFRLNDDPNYQPGATSVKIADTVLFNRIEWKRSISMSWTDDSLKITAKVSAKPKLEDYATIEWRNTVKSQFKTANTDFTTITVIAENEDTDILTLSTEVQAQHKVSGSAKPSSKGTVKVASKQSISAKFKAGKK